MSKRSPRLSSQAILSRQSRPGGRKDSCTEEGGSLLLQQEASNAMMTRASGRSGPRAVVSLT